MACYILIRNHWKLWRIQEISIIFSLTIHYLKYVFAIRWLVDICFRIKVGNYVRIKQFSSWKNYISYILLMRKSVTNKVTLWIFLFKWKITWNYKDRPLYSNSRLPIPQFINFFLDVEAKKENITYCFFFVFFFYIFAKIILFSCKPYLGSGSLDQFHEIWISWIYLNKFILFTAV